MSFVPECDQQPREGALLTVRCLLGHRQVGLTCTCLGSLIRNCKDAFKLILHDDGSLVDSDRARLHEELGGPEFVSKKAADEKMEAKLRRLPATLEWRRSNDALALKALDCVYHETGPVSRQIDSDIFFFRPFVNLFGLPDDVDGVFLADVQAAYSIRSWHLLPWYGARRLELADRVNSGLVCLRRSAYDPELIEWFLQRPGHRTHPFYLEQTTWALLAPRIRAKLVNPRQIGLIRPGTKVTEEVVALHFVSSHRSLLNEYIHLGSPDSAGQLVACQPSIDGSNGPAARSGRYAPARMTRQTTSDGPLVTRFDLVTPRHCTPRRLAAVETRRVLDRLVLRFRPKSRSA